MTIFSRRPLLRWLVPVLVAVLLGAGGAVVGAISAVARGGLPQRSAAQLLVDVQKARLAGLSGTVVQNAALGLPALPGMQGGSGSSDLSSLVSGSHTLRVWYGGPGKVRVALLGSLGESDLVRNGTDLWVWSSRTRSATHRTLPAATGPRSLAEGSAMTPQQAADAALKAITPSTRVSSAGTATVAGRAAYELVLQPRDQRSLVASVRIAIDGKTHVPTRVQVFSTQGGAPAFEVGFTSFDPTVPDPSVFRFNPPPGTKVTEGPAGGPSLRHPSGPAHQKGAATAAPTVVGSGWTSVAVAHLPAGTLAGAGQAGRMLQALPVVHGSWGSGHLLRGTLFSAVLTTDGRLAVGAVPPEMLYAALGSR